jgi:hypothetical protein
MTRALVLDWLRHPVTLTILAAISMEIGYQLASEAARRLDAGRIVVEAVNA